MGRKQDFVDVMERRIPSHVPLWELHFHLWSVLSKGSFVSGQAFNALCESEKERAICEDVAMDSGW